jgi:hypothetical protein
MLGGDRVAGRVRRRFETTTLRPKHHGVLRLCLDHEGAVHDRRVFSQATEEVVRAQLGSTCSRSPRLGCPAISRVSARPLSVRLRRNDVDMIMRSSISLLALGLVLGVLVAATGRHLRQLTAGGRRTRERRWRSAGCLRGLGPNPGYERRRSPRWSVGTSVRPQVQLHTGGKRERDRARHHAFPPPQVVAGRQEGAFASDRPLAGAHTRPSVTSRSERCFPCSRRQKARCCSAPP